ncbi:MAG: threonine synthase [Tissierellia bacterium]|nr:threonine synthase [Tissierellia bacterium]
MKYTSTRDNKVNITGTQAVIKGISDEGGLFLPKEFPTINIQDFRGLTYQEIAINILELYFPEISYEELEKIVNNYNYKFENSKEITPIKTFDNISFLELFHGPTSSFKDMALSLLPGLMRAAYDVNNITERLLILTATSGDTGSAALEGFKSQDRTEIAVFYPDGGVSDIQKLQMELSDGGNASVFSITGNFDDAQRSVKEIFADDDIKENCLINRKNLGSANSINIARLISQIPYYVYSYVTLLEKGIIKDGEKIDIIVPTGNFGDILAGIYAKFMGVPIENAICASNSNDVLTEFFNTGYYNANREFLKTLTPSMDILISSNLERFLYTISKGDSEEIVSIYDELKQKGSFKFPRKLPDYIKGISADDKRTKEIIKEVFEKHKYLIDPHTAVAYEGVSLTKNHALVVSTASPYKFPDAILEAFAIKIEGNLEEKINKINNFTNSKIPVAIENMLAKEIEEKHPLKIGDIKKKVMEILER